MGVGDQVGTRLTQLSTGLKLKLKLGKYIHFKDTVSDRIFLKIKLSLGKASKKKKSQIWAFG